MKITTVKLTFKGNETVNEIYNLYINGLKEAAMMLDEKEVAVLMHKRYELLELLAIVENKIAVGRGHRLATLEK